MYLNDSFSDESSRNLLIMSVGCVVKYTFRFRILFIGYFLLHFKRSHAAQDLSPYLPPPLFFFKKKERKKKSLPLNLEEIIFT